MSWRPISPNKRAIDLARNQVSSDREHLLFRRIKPRDKRSSNIVISLSCDSCIPVLLSLAMHSKSPGSNLSTFCRMLKSVFSLQCDNVGAHFAITVWRLRKVRALVSFEVECTFLGLQSDSQLDSCSRLQAEECTQGCAQLQIIRSHANFWPLCLQSAL